jgi:hypothetical protein
VSTRSDTARSCVLCRARTPSSDPCKKVAGEGLALGTLLFGCGRGEAVLGPLLAKIFRSCFVNGLVEVLVGLVLVSLTISLFCLWACH